MSSTIQDLTDYRQTLQEILIKEAEVACFLSEDWSGGYDDIVQKCRDHLWRASGFLLLLGYWYGSKPPGSEKSITHMEFEWAMERWGCQPYPPIAVFMPKDNSEAEAELRALAKPLLSKETDREQHDSILKAFHAKVNSWRGIYRFPDRHYLQRRVLVSCLEWKGLIPMAAAQGRVDVKEVKRPTRQVSKAQLGLLGRVKQLEAVRDILAVSRSFPEVPAIALLVYGDEDAEPEYFLHHLKEAEEFADCRPARIGKPPDPYDLTVLTQRIADDLGLIGTSEIGTPEELAEKVATELKQQPLFFILDQAHQLPEGVKTFQHAFWQSFYSRLQVLRAQKSIVHRLVAVVADYTGDTTGWSDIACEPDAVNGPEDYAKLLMLPKLGGFTKLDVLRWLEKLKVPEDVPGKRSRLADRVLKNARGESDHTPIRVLKRLSRETLWPEDDDK